MKKKVDYPLDVLKEKRKQLCVRGEGLRRKTADQPFFTEFTKELESVRNEIDDLDYAISLLNIAREW